MATISVSPAEEDVVSETKSIVLVGLDVEARGVNLNPANPDYSVQALASVGFGAMRIDFEGKTRDSDGKFELSGEPMKYGKLKKETVFFPDPLGDLGWKGMPGTAAEFWDRNPDALQALRDGGHWFLEGPQLRQAITEACRKVKEVLDSCMNGSFDGGAKPDRAWLVMDTAMFDRAFLSVVLVELGYPPLPYGEGFKYGTYSIVEYDHLQKSLRCLPYVPEEVRDRMMSELKKTREQVHNHRAEEDATSHLLCFTKILEICFETRGALQYLWKPELVV